VVGVVAVAARMFSEEQLEQLRSFPDIARDDLIRYFTLTRADVAFVDPGRGRGPADRLGLAVQLCALPWLGFVPDAVDSAPPVAVARLAERLGLDPEVLEGYGRRSHTRSDHLLLVDVILPVLADPTVPDEQVGGLLRERIGMSVLRDVVAGAWKPLAKDHGRLSAMDSSYSYLRQFTPGVLAAVDFTGGPGTADLMAAVAILKNLNASGGRKVPADAPTSFVPARYADYLEKARRAGDDTGFRHYWELCVILGLRDGLRSGDIFVPGSRRYADPSTYLYTPGQWMPRQGEYCRLVGKPARAADAIAQGQEELHAALAELESTLAGAAR
jgi:hypothetical protein